MSIEAMKQALDALEGLVDLAHEAGFPCDKAEDAITSLRQAIAEAEQVSYSGNGTAGRENTTAPTGFFFQMPKAEKQEPVACPYCKNWATLGAVYYDQNCAGCVKRMTHPQPKREPLTPVVPDGADINQRISFKAGWRAAEAAHGIKE